MKALAIAVVLATTLGFPSMEAQLRTEAPAMHTDAQMADYMNQAYEQGFRDGSAPCTLPDGPRVPRR